MKYRRQLWITVASAILASTMIAQAQEPKAAAAPAKPKLTEVEQASCLIKITCAPSTLLLNDETISALLSSIGVAKAASEAVFGNPYDGQVDFDMMVTAPEGAAIQKAGLAMGATGGRPRGMMGGGMMGGGMMGASGGGGFGGAVPGTPPVVTTGLSANTILGRIEVISDYGAGAPEFLEAVCTRLEDVLRDAHESELANHKRQLAQVEGEVERASFLLEELRTKQRELCEKLDMVEISRESLVDRVRHLEEEQLELGMQEVSQRARRAAIENQIQDLRSSSGRSKVAEAELNAAKAKLSLLNTKRKQFVELSKQNAVSTMEFRELEAEMLVAEAEVVKHQQKLEESAGGEMVAELNRHLAEQMIDDAERDARLAWIESKVAHYKRALEVATQTNYENLITLELPLARDAYAQARHMQAELDRRIRLSQPPTVTVLGGR